MSHWVNLPSNSSIRWLPLSWNQERNMQFCDTIHTKIFRRFMFTLHKRLMWWNLRLKAPLTASQILFNPAKWCFTAVLKNRTLNDLFKYYSLCFGMSIAESSVLLCLYVRHNESSIITCIIKNRNTAKKVIFNTSTLFYAIWLSSNYVALLNPFLMSKLGD